MIKHIILLLTLIIVFTACENDGKDIEKPEVRILQPVNCDTVYIGQTFTLKAALKDNQALGSYSISIHHNFDHHGHSTEIESCNLWDKKNAVNDYRVNKSFVLDGNPESFMAENTIEVPEGVDEGDYHLNLTVIDAEGWSQFQIIGIKVLKQ